MKGWLRSLFACALCAGALGAQRVWTVTAPDPVQPVIDAAAPGDRIELSEGVFTNFRFEKGLTIVGSGIASTVLRRVDIANLPASQAAVLSNAWCTDLWAQQCAGSLVLDRLQVGVPESINVGSIEIHDCLRVHVRDTIGAGLLMPFSPLYGNPAIRASGSTLVLERCSLYGSINLHDGTPAIHLTDCALIAVDCFLRGGPAGRYFDPFAWLWTFGTPAPALRAMGTDVLVLGRSRLEGGRYPTGGVGTSVVTQRPARLADDVVLFGDWSGSRRIPKQPVLSVANESEWGATTRVAIRGRPGDLAALFLDVTLGGPLLLAGSETPYFLTGSAELIEVTTLDGLGDGSFALRLPALATAVQGAVFLQAFDASPATRSLSASAPVSLIVR